MATATWSITEDDVFSLLQLATQFNNDNNTLGFEASQIPSALATTFVEELLELHENKNIDFEPWGRKLARWANTSVPIVLDAIENADAGTQRITEDGDIRITENGDIRITED